MHVFVCVAGVFVAHEPILMIIVLLKREYFKGVPMMRKPGFGDAILGKSTGRENCRGEPYVC